MTEKDRLKKEEDDFQKSLEEICSSTWEPLYHFVYYKVQNREEAEEITQETYVRVLPKIRKNIIETDNYLGLLKTVSLNILRDRWRKTRRHGLHMDFETDPDQIISSETSPGPAEIIAEHELIEKALSMLNDDQREVIVLRIVKGYSVAETSRLMNKKEGTIRVMQYRALQALNKILKDVKEI